jgi:hypothetical protein
MQLINATELLVEPSSGAEMKFGLLDPAGCSAPGRASVLGN